MKAIHTVKYGGPEVLSIVDIPKPSLEPNHMIVKIHSIGINPVEVYIREGALQYGTRDFPFILGTDFSGIIEEISPELNETKFKIGSRVFGFLRTKIGTYCEFISVNPETEVIGLLPDSTTFEQGAAIGIPFLTCYQALLHTAELKSHQTLFVHGGSGGVGIAAIQIAKSLGANVLTTAGSDEGEKNCKDSGASKVFRHNVKGYEEEIIDYCKKSGIEIDIILENAMHFNANIDINIIKTGGHILVVGARHGMLCEFGNVLYKQIKIEGVIIFSMTQSNFKTALEDIENKLKSKAYNPIFYSFPFTEISKAHNEIMTPKSGASKGKIVLNI